MRRPNSRAPSQLAHRCAWFRPSRPTAARCEVSMRVIAATIAWSPGRALRVTDHATRAPSGQTQATSLSFSVCLIRLHRLGPRCTRQERYALRDDSHVPRTPSPPPARALAGAAARRARSEAVRRGSLPVVEALLEAGADAQLRDDRRHTAPYIAVGYRDLAIIDA